MEVQPLLYMFPQDISLLIYNKLCILKKLPTELHTHIIHFHHIHDIYRHYKSIFSNDPSHDDYYMYWLENDLVLHLNNNISTNNGVSIELKKEHSFITTEFLQKKIPIHDLSSRIFKLWCLFNLDKQVQFIRIQCNDIYHL